MQRDIKGLQKRKKIGKKQISSCWIKSHDIKKEIIKNARFLRRNEHYKDVYINKDLTRYEIEEEKALKILRYERNHELEFEEHNLKYGKMLDGNEYYSGIRSGTLVKINNVTKRALWLRFSIKLKALFCF